jgi:hypothetical protein
MVCSDGESAQPSKEINKNEYKYFFMNIVLNKNIKKPD